MNAGVTICLTHYGGRHMVKVVTDDALTRDWLLIDKPVAKAVALRLRLFNFYRMAQAMAARVLEAGTYIDIALAAPRILADGALVTPPARWQYAEQARAEEDRAATFRSVMPTDHLLVPDRMFVQRFPAPAPAQADLSVLLIAFVDRCLSVSLTQVMESEARDA